MLAFCTYCSAKKQETTTTLSAIDLYISDRIQDVFRQAQEANTRFIILSGKYGLLEPDDKIDYYDHLLIASEVEAHSTLIAQQLKTKHISKLVFFTNTIEQDQNLKPYIDCITKAAKESDVELEIRYSIYKD